ncbi:MAG: response regulator [Sphingobacteriales bacterium]|nr:MAG: response regulator [Sphingobacteriales bacterium]
MIKIVLIEDDAAIADAISVAFDNKQYDISIFTNATPILNDQFEAPDIFIIDRQLVGIDGLEICRYLKAHAVYKNIPVVITSASPMTAPFAIQAGAAEFLEKSFTLKTLRGIIEKYC